MGFLEKLQSDREEFENRRILDNWKYRNKKKIGEIPEQLNIASRIVRDRIDGRIGETRTLQLERKLADLGCPGFEKYRG